MQKILKSASQTSAARRKKRTATYLAGLLILLSLFPVVILKASAETRELPTLVMRVDDIQDFAFREAQFFLFDESVANQVPLCLGVIAGRFGEDSELVQKVKIALNSGSEVAVHGWEHEDLAELSLEEQAALLSQSRSRIKEILDCEVNILVPPMFSFNGDTATAMHEEGYNIISTITDYAEPGLMSQVINIPATIELSDFKDSTWNMKSLDSVKAEISKSIQKYGFAVIVTHPQEFMVDGKLDQGKTELYRVLLSNLTADYSFKTLEILGETLEAQP